MESILIHPENDEQSETVKDFLNNLNVPFESRSADLPVHVMDSIEKGLTDYQNSKVISLNEFKEKHFLKNELGDIILS